MSIAGVPFTAGRARAGSRSRVAASVAALTRRVASFVLAASALSCAWLVATQAAASTVRALSLEELTRKADVIVVGVADEAQSRRHIDGRLIVTDVSLHVEQVLKGSASATDTLIVTLLGGALDGVGLDVPGEASLPRGQRALVFLQHAPRSHDLRVVGMAQGVMPIETQGQTLMVLPGAGAGALVERGSDGALHPAPAPLMQPEPADSVLDRVRKLVAASTK